MLVFVRRVATLAFAAAVAFSASAARPAPASAAELTIYEAERAMVRILNADRKAAGLVPIQIDSRLMAIARARSADMATKGYFSHTQPDGRTVFDILTAKGIKWYSAGEIIAWNTWPTLTDSANAANSGWLNSPSHRAIIMATSYNYLGVGLAIDSSGKKLWTGVFMKGPDRTGGWVTIDPQPETASIETASTSDTASSFIYTRKVTWRGGDVRLVVLTAGFRNYQIQRNWDGGSYIWITKWTTLPYRTMSFYSGHVYSIRIRACDKAGNCGAWRYTTVRG